MQTMIILFFIAGLSAVVLGDGQTLAIDRRDDWEEADHLLQQYRVTVDEVVNSAEQTLNETQQDTLNTANAMKGIARRMLINIEHGFNSELDYLEEAAKNSGVDPSSCVQDAKRAIQAIRVRYVNDIIWCINDRWQESKPLFDDVFSNLANARQSVVDFQTRIEECKSTNDLVALIVVVTQIEAQNALLPVILENDILEVSGLANNAELYYQGCTTLPVEAFRAQGPVIVRTAQQCIERSHQ